MTEGNGWIDRAGLLKLASEREYREIVLDDGQRLLAQSPTEAEAMHAAMLELGDDGEFDKSRVYDRRINAMILQLVDPQSKKPFLTMNDRPELRKLPARHIRLIYKTCQELSGITEDDVEEAEKTTTPAKTEDRVSAGAQNR